MHNDLKQRIELMRSRLNAQAPVAEIHTSSQLFVSPAPVCRRLVEMADVCNTDVILEPSAGTGAILQAIKSAAPAAQCDAVEQNGDLYRYLQQNMDGVNVVCGDFLEYETEKRYSKIIMNPPFQHAHDIKHIQRALTLLKPGGVLVAICLNGPRQERILKPLSVAWEVLPRNTFTYTEVSTVILKITG